MIAARLERAMRADPSAPALTLDDGTVLSRRALIEQVALRAARVVAKPGDIVTVRLQRSAEALLTELALSWAGATVLPIAPEVTTEAAIAIMDRVSARYLVRTPLLPAARPALPAEYDPDRPAAILQTSGSTGPPKLVPIPWRCIEASTDAFARRAGVQPGWRYVSHLPYEHVAERHWSIWAAFGWGWHVRVAAPGERARTLDEHRPQFHFAVPLQWERLADEPRPWLDSVRVAISASAPLSDEVLVRHSARGVLVTQLYGLSETANVLTAEVESPRLGTVGRALDCSELRIVDHEVQCRGANVFDGYVDTMTPRNRDWLCTGDGGILDEDGHLRLLGRIGDEIVTQGGVKLAPAPIEAELRASPLVQHALVAGTGLPRVRVVLVPVDASPRTRDAAARETRMLFDRYPPDARPDCILVTEPSDWPADLLTSAGKLRRARALDHFDSALRS